MNINLLTHEEEQQLRDLISQNNRIVITCHKSPDGDALGSSLGWAEYLRTQGKEPVVIVPDAYPDFLQWMPNSEKIIRYDKRTELADKLLSEAEVIYCLDFNDESRVYAMEKSLRAAKAKKVLIDHHLEPSMDVVLKVSHPQLCSTSEIVFRLIWQLGGFESIDKKCATSLYCGMMTDTGAFTFNSNYPEIYFIISQLLTKNINKDKIYRNVYNNYSSWAIRLRGFLMYYKLKVFQDVHASLFSISREDMVNFHFTKGDAEGLVNEPLRIKGQKLSISLREDDRIENLVWVSLRSVGTFPCNKMAEEHFSGGGHLNASGGRLECSLQEAERKTQEIIMSYADLLRS